MKYVHNKGWSSVSVHEVFLFSRTRDGRRGLVLCQVHRHRAVRLIRAHRSRRRRVRQGRRQLHPVSRQGLLRGRGGDRSPECGFGEAHCQNLRRGAFDRVCLCRSSTSRLTLRRIWCSFHHHGEGHHTIRLQCTPSICCCQKMAMQYFRLIRR